MAPILEFRALSVVEGEWGSAVDAHTETRYSGGE